MKGELGEAEWLLHQALRLAHQADNRRAVIYTYSLVTRRGGERWEPGTAASARIKESAARTDCIKSRRLLEQMEILGCVRTGPTARGGGAEILTGARESS